MFAFNSLAVFLFSAIALTIGSGYSLGAAMLFLGSAALLWKRPRLALKKEDYLLIGVFLFYFAVYTANVLLHGDPDREFDGPLRFLLVIPVLLSLLAYPAKPAAWWGGLAAGAIGAGLFVGWQHLAEGLERPGGNTNAIQYGNVSMLLGILCLCGLAWAGTRPRQAGWRALMAAGAAFGVLGSIFTGSRGGWIALPVCACVLAVRHGGAHGRRHLYAGLLALAALLAVLYALPQSSIRARSELAAREARAYLDTGVADSSVGIRLEMWRSALSMLPGHLWLGWGKQGYMEHKAVLIKQGKLAPGIGEYTNAHNEYLDALVKRGLVGLLALLMLYLAPLLLFARRLAGPDRRAHPYALAGVFLSLSYMLFGLTTTFFTLNIGVMMFAFPVVILWSLLRRQQPSTPRPIQSSQ